MAVRSPDITIRDVRVDLEELLTVIQNLDQPSRARIARALVEVEMDSRFKDLIQQLAARVPPEDLTDADIDREVRAVRDATRRA
jgi:hypothetical protein